MYKIAYALKIFFWDSLNIDHMEYFETPVNDFVSHVLIVSYSSLSIFNENMSQISLLNWKNTSIHSSIEEIAIYAGMYSEYM